MNSLQIQKGIDQMAATGLDTSSLDDEAFNIEAAQDRCILRLIASCCNGEILHNMQTPFVPFFYGIKLDQNEKNKN